MSDVHARRGLCRRHRRDVSRRRRDPRVSPIGTLPAIGARLAKLTFEPDLLMTDGVALPARQRAAGRAARRRRADRSRAGCRIARSSTWSGRAGATSMMGASQIDRFGNQNIACIGPFEKPKAQLLGMRGAPGNTINHPTSYWVPNHRPKVFVAEGRRQCYIW